MYLSVEKRLNSTIIWVISIYTCEFSKAFGDRRKKSEKMDFLLQNFNFIIKWRSAKIMLELIMQVDWALIMHVEHENHFTWSMSYFKMAKMSPA